jgi:hypothetical protein
MPTGASPTAALVDTARKSRDKQVETLIRETGYSSPGEEEGGGGGGWENEKAHKTRPPAVRDVQADAPPVRSVGGEEGMGRGGRLKRWGSTY